MLILECGLRIAKNQPPAMTKTELQQRTKLFALRVMAMVDALPKKHSAEVLGHQLLRSASSVAANYRAACRARSPAEFIAKMGIVEEEADESMAWLELLADSGLIKRERLISLMNEADQLVAITVASIKTARKNIQPKRKPS